MLKQEAICCILGGAKPQLVCSSTTACRQFMQSALEKHRLVSKRQQTDNAFRGTHRPSTLDHFHSPGSDWFSALMFLSLLSSKFLVLCAQLMLHAVLCAALLNFRFQSCLWQAAAGVGAIKFSAKNISPQKTIMQFTILDCIAASKEILSSLHERTQRQLKRTSPATWRMHNILLTKWKLHNEKHQQRQLNNDCYPGAVLITQNGKLSSQKCRSANTH